MKTGDKTLLIISNKAKNKTSSVVVDEDEVVAKTKEFLNKISRSYKKAQLSVYKPLGVVLKSEDKTKGYAALYEREKFVIVVPNGTAKSAKLYGNWNEALVCVQKLLTGECDPQKKSRFLLAEYVQK